jgi:hypothetical protein
MGMKVVRDDLWLCDDCTIYAVNDDLSGIDYYLSGAEADKRVKDVKKGVHSLGRNLVIASDSESGKGQKEFSSRPCDACHQPNAAGARTEFAILGPDTKKKR